MKSKKLLTVVSLLLMVLSSSAVMFAQEPSKVSGRVLDEDGNPLVGAFVSAKGTNAGTVTDVDGNFTLSVPVGSKVLLFSMLGQQEKELPYEVGKTWYQVVLMSDTQMIEETVVVGYGTMIKRELTSISVIGERDRTLGACLCGQRSPEYGRKDGGCTDYIYLRSPRRKHKNPCARYGFNQCILFSFVCC